MLIEMRSELAAWRSKIVARVGTAQVKVLRMDEAPYGEEQHAFDEVLLVLEGAMELMIGGQQVRVGAGQMYVVPAGVPHAVAPGSHGTLVIVDEP
jgi:mannose-6-phosphate isomerase-like protein (cupin superfamily)